MALQPSTGGTFVVEIFHSTSSRPSSQTELASGGGLAPARTVLWDRKTDGGFPETKELKRRVRDVIEPGRDLGHVDRNHAKPAAAAAAGASGEQSKAGTSGAQQQGGAGNEAQAAQTKDKPSRAELEAAGPAGAGYPGSSEAAAQLTGGACESKQECQDCD